MSGYCFQQEGDPLQRLYTQKLQVSNNSRCLYTYIGHVRTALEPTFAMNERKEFCETMPVRLRGPDSESINPSMAR